MKTKTDIVKAIAKEKGWAVRDIGPTPTGKAICMYEPRGEKGLEGYQLGESYDCEQCIGKDGRAYYRVWPVSGDMYYETCSVSTFNRFFEKE